ncbi:MAG: NADH-quinone oxidoreductase subunit [Actinomycetota bacterium]|jgi:NADH-quinone oxidoreductase subunit J|nr:NADH-quinone oxidoreductase subunit [Actinomycetota bacterium]MDQ1540579.1 NADH-quinone oxidoreductase subunit [Actinomycetota bacterium]
MPTAVLASSMHSGGPETAIFWIFAPLSVLAALGMVFSRNTVHGALLLGSVMLSLAVFYAAEDAPFLAFVQVIVYTGAVMMLFLFVLMLVGVDTRESLVETLRGQRLAASAAGLGFLILLFTGIRQASITTSVGLGAINNPPVDTNIPAQAHGNIFELAKLIFTRYIFAFEVTSALLITAALGAMVLAHRERHEPKRSQQEQMRDRFKIGTHPTPLPGPGVYARHNAVDTHALLPDGSPSELSVPPAVEELRLERGRHPRPSELGGSRGQSGQSTSGKGSS